MGKLLPKPQVLPIVVGVDCPSTVCRRSELSRARAPGVSEMRWSLSASKRKQTLGYLCRGEQSMREQPDCFYLLIAPGSPLLAPHYKLFTELREVSKWTGVSVLSGRTFWLTNRNFWVFMSTLCDPDRRPGPTKAQNSMY